MKLKQFREIRVNQPKIKTPLKVYNSANFAQSCDAWPSVIMIIKNFAWPPPDDDVPLFRGRSQIARTFSFRLDVVILWVVPSVCDKAGLYFLTFLRSIFQSNRVKWNAVYSYRSSNFQLKYFEHTLDYCTHYMCWI